MFMMILMANLAFLRYEKMYGKKMPRLKDYISINISPTSNELWRQLCLQNLSNIKIKINGEKYRACNLLNFIEFSKVFKSDYNEIDGVPKPCWFEKRQKGFKDPTFINFENIEYEPMFYWFGQKVYSKDAIKYIFLPLLKHYSSKTLAWKKLYKMLRNEQNILITGFGGTSFQDKDIQNFADYNKFEYETALCFMLLDNCYWEKNYEKKPEDIKPKVVETIIVPKKTNIEKIKPKVIKPIEKIKPKEEENIFVEEEVSDEQMLKEIEEELLSLKGEKAEKKNPKRKEKIDEKETKKSKKIVEEEIVNEEAKEIKRPKRKEKIVEEELEVEKDVSIDLTEEEYTGSETEEEYTGSETEEEDQTISDEEYD